MLGRVAVACAVVIAVAPQLAAAETVDELNERAKALVAKEDYAAAAELYRQAAARERDVAKHACNAGNAYYEADKAAEAALYLARCIHLDKDRWAKGHVKVFRHVVASITPKSGKAFVSITPLVAGSPHPSVRIWSAAYEEHGIERRAGTFLLPAGTHKFRIEMPGYKAVDLELKVRAGRNTSWNQELEKLDASQPDTVEPTPIARPEIRAETRAPPRGGRKAPWVSLGAAVVAGVGGVTLGQLADSDDRTADRLEFALYGVFAATAIFSVYLFLRDDSPASALSIAPTTQGDGAMVWMRWQK